MPGQRRFAPVSMTDAPDHARQIWMITMAEMSSVACDAVRGSRLALAGPHLHHQAQGLQFRPAHTQPLDAQQPPQHLCSVEREMNATQSRLLLMAFKMMVPTSKDSRA